MSVGVRYGETGPSWQRICHIKYHTEKSSQWYRDSFSDFGYTAWTNSFDCIISTYLKLGAMRAYEEQSQESGVLPLFSGLLKYTDSDYDQIKFLSVMTLRNVLDQTKWWASAKNSDTTINYFKLAITDANVEVLQLLLERGVDIHRRTDGKGSAVEHAFESQRAMELCARKGPEFLQQLLDHSDNRKLGENLPHGSRLSLLHRLATDEDATSILWLVKALVHRGVDVNGMAQDNKTPVLVYHVSKASYQCADLLLDLGADPGLSVPGSCDAAQIAITDDNVDFLKRILEHTTRTLTIVDWKRKVLLTDRVNEDDIVIHEANALHWAVMNEAVGCLSFYLDEGLLTIEESVSAEGLSPLHINAHYGSVEMTKILVDRGADVLAEDDTGKTPLHFAVHAESLPKVKLLVEHGAKEFRDHSGLTPRDYAFMMGHDDILEWLEWHDKHENVELLDQILVQDPSKSDVGNLFRDAAERFIRSNDLHCCKELFAKYQEFDSPLSRAHGSTLLFLSINQSKLDIATWLVNQGANVLKAGGAISGMIELSMLEKVVSTRGLESLVPGFLDAYWSQGGNLLVDDDYPLHHALWGGRLESLKILLECLVERMETYRTIVKSELSYSEAIKEILNRQYPDYCHSTALHSAAAGGNLEIASLLVEHGASVNSYERCGRTPLLLAANADMAEYLISVGASTAWLSGVSDIENLLPILGRPAFEEVSEIFLKYRPVSSQLQTPTAKLPLLCSAINLSPSIIQTMLQCGIDLMSADEGGRSLMHCAICGEDSLDFVLDRNLELSQITPFPWHMYWRGLGMMAFLGSRFENISSALPRDILRKVLNMEPQRGRSPLCEAARFDFVDIIENCLSAGADIDFEGCPVGSALMVASACGNLNAVKFLISRNASTHYVGANGYRDCYTLAGTDEIRNWLLVGRFSERSTIQGGRNSSLTTDEPKVKPRGGVAQARLLLCGKRERRLTESSIEYAKRLLKMRREWRGRVAPVGKDGLRYPNSETTTSERV